MSEKHQIIVENPVLIEKKAFSLDRTVREFAEKNNSAETRRTYAAYLKEFFDFAKIQNGAQALNTTSSMFIRWREKMTAAGNKPNTVKTKLAAVRSF